MLHKIIFPNVTFKGPPVIKDGPMVDITPRVELIGLVSTVPPKGQQGFTVQDIRGRTKLLELLEAAEDSDDASIGWVVLDEPEYLLLQSVVEDANWTTAGLNSAAVKLADAIDNAEETDPVEAMAKE